MSQADDERVLSLEKVTGILGDVVINEGFIDPVYEVSSGAAKGDGFTSFMTKVIVKGDGKVLPLIIKCAPKSESMRKTLPIRVSFLQEINYYQEVFPAFRKFQKSKGLRPFDSMPACYKTNSAEFHEIIVLENIKEKGFTVHDKRKQMDQVHVEMVLKTYGKFHAISFAMKDQDPAAFEKISLNRDSVFSKKNLNQDFYDLFEEGARKLQELFNNDAERDVYNYFADWKNSVAPTLNNVGAYTGKYGVLTHGDCWCNNMMFKYEGGMPSDIRLFDFQGGCLTSPVIDLSYFFYVTASQEMLDNQDRYLKIYHDSLSSYMSQMGSDVERHFPFSAFKEEWKRHGIFGLALAPGVFRAMFQDEDAVLDFSDNLSPVDTFMKGNKYDHIVNERCRRVGLHFYKNKLL